jgi:hypothetical protein
MDHVINYDFPASGRVFVHRVGRTARAGRKGAAWSLVTSADLPYLVDLQILLDRPLLDQSTRLYGQIPRQRIDEKTEYLASTLDESAPQLKSLRQVMQRGESMVQRSRSKASPKAYREAKGLQRGATADATHPAFADKANEVDDRRNILLETIGAYQPRDTVLEIGRSKDDPSGRLMQARRDLLKKRSTPRTVNTNPDTRQPVQPGDQVSVAAVRNSHPTSVNHFKIQISSCHTLQPASPTPKSEPYMAYTSDRVPGSPSARTTPSRHSSAAPLLISLPTRAKRFGPKRPVSFDGTASANGLLACPRTMATSKRWSGPRVAISCRRPSTAGVSRSGRRKTSA